MKTTNQTETSATKPDHTPSVGAMRAARALAVSKPLIDAIHSGVGQYGIAQIIDRETAHAELVAALEKMTASFTSSVHYNHAVRSKSKGYSVTKAMARWITDAEEARAALAKAKS